MTSNGKIKKVVKSEPPKKLSEWFISNDQSNLEDLNVWCFDQATAVDVLIQLQLDSPALEVKSIKI